MGSILKRISEFGYSTKFKNIMVVKNKVEREKQCKIKMTELIKK